MLRARFESVPSAFSTRLVPGPKEKSKRKHKEKNHSVVLSFLDLAFFFIGNNDLAMFIIALNSMHSVRYFLNLDAGNIFCVCTIYTV